MAELVRSTLWLRVARQRSMSGYIRRQPGLAIILPSRSIAQVQARSLTHTGLRFPGKSVRIDRPGTRFVLVG